MNKWTIFHGYAAMLNNQMVNMECDKETLGLHKQIWQPLFSAMWGFARMNFADSWKHQGGPAFTLFQKLKITRCSVISRWFGWTNLQLILLWACQRSTITVGSLEAAVPMERAKALDLTRPITWLLFANLKPDEKPPLLVMANHHFKIAPTPLGTTIS